jgi:hypothetical protein
MKTATATSRREELTEALRPETGPQPAAGENAGDCGAAGACRDRPINASGREMGGKRGAACQRDDQ